MFDISQLTEGLMAKALRFGLTQEETKKFCVQIGRTPTTEELAVCGALWSEHCSYKSSRIHLKRLHTDEPWVLQGPGENAGVVAINENYGIVFKMESHNHPSYVEPYQGAATGVGGILRDIFCMGATPIANLNCLRFGEGTWNAALLRDTVRGIGDYGNSVGVPTITGNTAFHVGYSENILVNAFTAGIVHKDKIYKGIVSIDEKNNESTKQNILIYFGSATGRDGVHGATMSSAEFQTGSATLKPTIQVGDPFAQKILLEATLALIEKELVVGLQDMGAAGLTSSSVEMAGRSGCGVALNLNLVPQRAGNMQPFEILLSESQERMLCAVEPHQVERVLEELKKFDVSCAVIGQVNHTGVFECTFDGVVVTALPISVLVEDIPCYQWPLQPREDYLKENKNLRNDAKEKVQLTTCPEDKKLELSLSLNGQNQKMQEAIKNGLVLESFLENFPNALNEIFAHPSFASKEPLYRHYCSTVKGNTIAGCGALQSAAAGVVLLPRFAQEIDGKGARLKTGLAIAGGCEERWVEIDPFLGSAQTVLQVARKIIAVGGIPLGMTDCLNFGSPRSTRVMRQFSDSVDGIHLVAKEMRIPVVSGNVSLNNQTQGKSIPPTPMIGMVGKVHDVSFLPLQFLPERYFEDATQEVYLWHVCAKSAIEDSSYDASQVAWMIGGQNSCSPKVDLKLEKLLWKEVQKIIFEQRPLLCFPVGHGGLLGSLIGCSLRSDSCLELTDLIWKKEVSSLFAEGNMGFLFGFAKEKDMGPLASGFTENGVHGLCAQFVGKLKSEGSQIQKSVMNLREISQSNHNSLQRYFDALRVCG